MKPPEVGNLVRMPTTDFVPPEFAVPTEAIFGFNRTAAGMAGAMLALAVAALVFPALFHSTHSNPAALDELHLSEAVAVILAVVYLLSLRSSRKSWSVPSSR